MTSGTDPTIRWSVSPLPHSPILPFGSRRMSTFEQDTSDLRLLDPREIRLKKDPFSRLHLEVGFEERYGPVRAVRCLPLTKPDRFISIQDEEGVEIGIIADVAQLDPESRAAMNEALDFYYLKAQVSSIKKVETKNGIISWEL